MTDTNKSNDVNRRGNSNNNNYRKNRYNNNFKKITKEKFKGKCKDLEGFIFDADKFNQADGYIKTKNEIAEYVGTNYNNVDDIRAAIEEGIKPVLSRPVKPAADQEGNLDETDELIWKKEIDHFVKRKNLLDSNLRKAYSLVWGQCSNIMRKKLEALPKYAELKSKFHVLALLREIKNINFKFEDQKYPFGSVYFANKRFVNYKQASGDSNNEHYDKFNNIVSVLDSYGIKLGQEAMLLDVDEIYLNLDASEKEKAIHITVAHARNKERFSAFCFLSKADDDRYRALKNELENDFTKGADWYPKTMTNALYLLTNYKRDHKKKAQHDNPDDSTVSFAQNGNNNNKFDDKYDDAWHKTATCHQCGKVGHIRPNCPDKN